MDTAQAIADVHRLCEESPADAASDLSGYSMQAIMMQTPSGGVQIPQLSLQQT